MASIISEEVLSRVEALHEQFRGAKPFPHVVIDGFLRPELCQSLIESFPAYDEQKFLNEWNERGKAWHENVPALGDAFAELDAGLRSESFLGVLSQVSGIPDLLFDPSYFGGGTHENLHGMELDPHIWPSDQRNKNHPTTWFITNYYQLLQIITNYYNLLQIITNYY